MPQVLFLSSPLNVGGRRYLTGEEVAGLTEEEMDFYKRRGIGDVRPSKGAVITRSVEQARPVETNQEQGEDAATKLAERTRRAAEQVGKRNGR